jgi:CHASE1-domain containing sensor protein
MCKRIESVVVRKFLPIIVFVAIASAGLLMAATAYVASQQAARFKFEATTDDALALIDARIDQHIALLRSASAFMRATGGEATDEQFSAFVDTLELRQRFGGVQGMGFARLVPVAEQEKARQELARHYGQPLDLHPAATDQDWRAVVMMFAPVNQSNRLALGFDMFSDPDRRNAMQEAMATGEPRATVPLVLLGTAPSFAGFVVYLPVFPIADGEAVAQGEGGLVPDGFVYATFRADELFGAALGPGPARPVKYEIHDGAPQEGRLLYRSIGEPAGGSLSVHRELGVAGRPWTIDFVPTDVFEPPISSLVAYALGVVGLLLAVAVAFLLRSQAQAYDAMTRLQVATEKSLQDKDLMLREMSHRIKNSIARVMAMARHTAAGSRDLEEFSAAFGARLQAMAASQDVLTRSSWRKADLAELLRVELGQVFGDDLPPEIIEGPGVMLSEAEAQALGLTFHELATNALKYGEAGSSVGALRVRWEVGGARLRIRWAETGQPTIVPPTRIGFGTRLIDINIKHELGGRIERTYRDDGLTVDIEIPLQEAKPAKAPR